jgi:Uma2 family endonuclease
VTLALRLTSADLECLPDIEGFRYEIIDGALYVSRQPTLGHQFASGRMYSALDSWSDESGMGFAFVAPGLVFASDADVVPDLVWISRERLVAAQDEHGHLTVSPEVVVEVLSPGRVNQMRDREAKRRLYSRQGAQEYWIVDWQQRLVEVYRREGAALQLIVTLQDGDVLTSPLLPGFSCPVARLWSPSIG